MKNQANYIIITPAKNEAANIEATIRSVIASSIQPRKWIIVNDGSSDGTENIVASFLSKYDFIRLINLESNRRDFASKVFAFNAGFETIKNQPFDFIGNLDADISFAPNYYERLLEEFVKNPKLGIAGGFVLEEHNGILQNRFGNSVEAVAGGVQLFRRQCYFDVGGYMPLEFGCEDMVSQVYAKMYGWEVRSFPEIQTIHRGKLNLGKFAPLMRFYKEGKSEYMVGYHPLFEMLKFIKRLPDKPYFWGSLFRFCGYLLALLNPNIKTKTPAGFISFLRREQIQRLRFLS